MGRLRGHRKLAGVLVACVAIGGAIAAIIITTSGDTTTALPTTGAFAPITVVRPKVPVIGGGIPVDVDPVVARTDLSTALAPLPGKHRYRMSVANSSSLGAINSFQWYPPTGVHVLKLVGSTQGHCTLSGLTGFGGSQFPTVVLYPNIYCDRLDLKPPSCTCLGDGGAVTITFVTDRDIGGSLGDTKMRTATLVFDRIPVFLK